MCCPPPYVVETDGKIRYLTSEEVAVLIAAQAAKEQEHGSQRS